MRSILCVLALLAGRPSPSASTTVAIPRGRTPAAKLATPALEHHEVMRIDRDFGKARWEIALDGWMPRTRTDRIEDIRLWWVDTEDADARKPFNAHLRRFVALTYDRDPGGHLAVRLEGDRKAYRFTVEQHAGGALSVFADVKLADGTTVPHCRAERGRLLARRMWGIPIGIAALNVTCVDAEDRVHEGAVPYEELASGAVWEAP
jgi:hypothetical protein